MGRLLAAQIGKPHGTSGEVYVIRISDDPERFAPGATLLHEDGRTLTVESSRPHRDRFLVRFQGVSDRVSAEELRGSLFIDEADRRELEPDEYWPDDLIGCDAFDRDGHLIGRVTEISSNSAQDLLVLDGRNLVPMVQDIVVSVDVAAGRIVLDPPEGLIE